MRRARGRTIGYSPLMSRRSRQVVHQIRGPKETREGGTSRYEPPGRSGGRGRDTSPTPPGGGGRTGRPCTASDPDRPGSGPRPTSRTSDQSPEPAQPPPRVRQLRHTARRGPDRAALLGVRPRPVPGLLLAARRRAVGAPVHQLPCEPGERGSCLGRPGRHDPDGLRTERPADPTHLIPSAADAFATDPFSAPARRANPIAIAAVGSSSSRPTPVGTRSAPPASMAARATIESIRDSPLMRASGHTRKKICGFDDSDIAELAANGSMRMSSSNQPCVGGDVDGEKVGSIRV